jgi:hypothetical protein
MDLIANAPEGSEMQRPKAKTKQTNKQKKPE